MAERRAEMHGQLLHPGRCRQTPPVERDLDFYYGHLYIQSLLPTFQVCAVKMVVSALLLYVVLSFCGECESSK